MSKVIAFHTSRTSLKHFAEDIHGDGEYLDLVLSAIDSLWSRFNISIENPYNVALCNVMHYLSKMAVRDDDLGEMYEEIIDEVEDSFHHCDRIDDLGDNDAIGESFYLFCPLLMDYLIEEEQIREIGKYNIEFIIIHNNRIDLTI